MKKALFTAAFAALALSAHALTTGWDELSNGIGGMDRYNGQATNQTIWANVSGTLAANVVLSGDIGSGTILATGGNGYGTNNAIVVAIQDGQWTLSVLGTEAASYTMSNRTVSAGSNAVGIAVTRGVAGTGSDKVEVSINGQVLATVEGLSFSGPIGSYAWGQTVNQQNRYSGSATYEVFLLDGNANVALDASAIAADLAVLPEPTALALLALGVAGVALRRRVA